MNISTRIYGFSNSLIINMRPEVNNVCVKNYFVERRRKGRERKMLCGEEKGARGYRTAERR